MVAVEIESWIYFVGYDGRMIKIGTAQLPKKRFFAIKGASPVPVELLGVMPGNQSEERKLHKRWAAHRVHNEWFSATPEIVGFVKANAVPVESITTRPIYWSLRDFRLGEPLQGVK